MTKFKVVKTYELEIEAEDMLKVAQMVTNDELDFSEGEENVQITVA